MARRRQARREKEFTDLTQKVRSRLIGLMGIRADEYTCVLMQGSGTFSVEAQLERLFQKAESF